MTALGESLALLFFCYRTIAPNHTINIGSSMLTFREFSSPYLNSPPLTLQVDAGTHLWVRGPSGLGKSTLLRALLGLVPWRGELLWKNTPLRGTALQSFRRQCGWIPQEPPSFAGSLEKWLPEWNRAWQHPTLDITALQPIFASLGLPTDIATRDLLAFSGGERRRLFTALALARRCRVFLFDETFAALDESTRRSVATLVHAANPELVILIAHDADAAPNYTQVLHLQPASPPIKGGV